MTTSRQERIQIPNSEHEPFITSFEIHYNSLVPSSSTFMIAITTKYLLSLALKTGHICADTTFKLIWQGFPVLAYGTTDLQRHFNPVSIYLCSNESTEDFILIFSNLKESISNEDPYVRKCAILCAAKVTIIK